MAVVYTQSEAENYLRKQSKYNELKQNYLDRNAGYLNDYNAGLKQINDELSTGKANLSEQFRTGLSQLGKSYSQQGSELGRNFTQSMSEAFDAAQKQRSSFLSQSASIGSGQRQSIARDLDVATTNAYDSYIQNYIKNKQLLDTNLKSGSEELKTNRDSVISQLEMNAQNAKTNLGNQYNKLIEQDNKKIEQIEKDVAKEAENFAALANTPVEYLQYLWENNPDLFNDDLLGRYTYLDESGVRQLMTGAQMDRSFFTYNEDGSKELTPEGKELYSIIAYGLGDTGEAFGFNDYIADTNKELYEWAIGLNKYGDNEFVNRQGYTSNFDAVMGSLLGSDIVASESYKASKSNLGSQYNQNINEKTSYDEEGNVYNVETRQSSKGTSIESFTNVEFTKPDGKAKNAAKGFEYKDIVEGKAETFTAKIGTEEYKFEATKKEAESDILDDIVDAYDSIAEKKIYNYSGTYYMGVKNKDGKMVLRKLKLKGNKTKKALNEK